ncbi:MAG: TIGR02594 family protein [Burkholderiaceae bacterium]
MEIAWADAGVEEVSGPKANPRIVEYFRGVGRPDITSDEIAWCAAAVGFYLLKAGISIDQIPKEKRLLARSFAAIGTPLPKDQPRVGAIAVLSRGSNPAYGHVGFVTGWTKDQIVLLGGNQSNKVCTQHFARSRIVALRWPEPPAKPKDLEVAGSRTAAAAKRQQKDAGKATLAQSSNVAVPDAPASAAAPTPPPADAAASLPDPNQVLETGSQWKGLIETAESLALFCWAKWPWIAGALALYWLARMAWDAWRVRRWRAEDHNTGANTARAVAEEPAGVEADLELEEAA